MLTKEAEMNAKDAHWHYQFTSKGGKRIYYNCQENLWAVEIDYSALIEPTVQETAEILNFIVETQMDAWGELFGET
jgi:hypothetical protein